MYKRQAYLSDVVVITTRLFKSEKEVFQALELFDLGEQKSSVKAWYDGFIFGSKKDIYNPWSITNFLKEGQIRSYWAATSSNGPVSYTHLSPRQITLQTSPLFLRTDEKRNS